MPEIRYVEASGYYTERAEERSSSGCGVSPASNIPKADYTTVAPGTKVSWNFYDANIPLAWETTTGDGVEVCIIDTGASDSQDNLGSNFNSGFSSNRTITKKSTHYSGWWFWRTLDSPNDQCGHGTQMAGLAAAPRSDDGNATGIAYNADLLTIRAVADVIISSSNEKKGVRNALKLAARRNNCKVISMSIGTIFYSSTVADGVYYAYNYGKLIFAAAGTSTSFTNGFGVIFPAIMNETVAITGVREGLPLQECNTSHYGAKVDFVAVMQHRTNDRTSLTLAPCCDTPSYVGGSSASTAITAGIATLVWSMDPSMSRATVMQYLKEASSLYPNRDNNFGWGTIDADLAVSLVL